MQKQGKIILANQQHALMYAVFLALFPYTAWLSTAVIALVTLRKGWRDGAFLLLTVSTAHLLLSLTSLSLTPALINTFVIFVPCYLAACGLRITASWQTVAAVFFFQVILTAILVKWFVPELIMAQYKYLLSMLSEVQTDKVLSNLLADPSNVKQMIFASFAFGIQMLTIVLSSISSLMMARSMQANLYYPGGFKQELLAFCGNRIGLLLFVVMFAAAMQHNVIAMVVLPVVVLYFLLAGLSLSANMLIKKNSRLVFLILIAPLIMMPFVMVPMYVALGLLDCLFNLRVYFVRA